MDAHSIFVLEMCIAQVYVTRTIYKKFRAQSLLGDYLILLFIFFLVQGRNELFNDCTDYSNEISKVAI